MVFKALGHAVDSLGIAAFYLEQDSARRYRDLTGIDLGQMVTEPDRYEKAIVKDDEEDE